MTHDEMMQDEVDHQCSMAYQAGIEKGRKDLQEQLEQRDNEIKSLKSLEDHLNKRDKINRDKIEKLERELKEKSRELGQLQGDSQFLVGSYKRSIESYKEKIKEIKNGIDLLETQDTSPEYDKGFTDCQQQVLDCFEEWPDNQLNEVEDE